jgi:hypothetical protein
MATVPALVAGGLAAVLVADAVSTPTLAASPTRDRVDIFDARGNQARPGRVEDGRRVDFFDPRGNRTGYAIIEGDRMEFFDTRSNRTGARRIRGVEVEMSDWQGNRSRLSRYVRPPGR